MYKESARKRTTISLLLLCLMTGTVAAQQPDVLPLMSKDLTGNPEKEVSMITVEYPPGGSDPLHRHHAQAFVYVLEGSVVMQVKGGKEVTLTPGQTFYEGRADTSAGQVTAGMIKTWPNREIKIMTIKEKNHGQNCGYWGKWAHRNKAREQASSARPQGLGGITLLGSQHYHW